MNTLRIRYDRADEPWACQWVFLEAGQVPVDGKGVPPAEFAGRAERVQLILPAAQVLFARARLPGASGRHAGQLLAFAVEDETLSEPDAHQVTLLGRAGNEDVLAVMDRMGLARRMDVLSAAGIKVHEVHCETLMLPWRAGEWSLAWNGREGFVRTGELEGAATDCGNAVSPPLSLLLMLEDEARTEKPASIAFYLVPCAAEGSDVPPDPDSVAAAESATGTGLEPGDDALPDIEAWQHTLGVPVRIAGTWDWRSAALQPGFSLAERHKQGQFFRGLLLRLRPAAWIVAGALVIHLAASAADWAMLVHEQRVLRREMEERFRQLFPGAALVDPALQMRRKLAEARHAAGVPDSADFLPMIETTAALVQQEAAGGVRAISYESGQMTLELAVDEVRGSRIAAGLEKAGFSVDISPVSAEDSAHLVLIVRAP